MIDMEPSYHIVCVCYLVQRYVRLIHQVDVELADESLQLLSVCERLRRLHLVTYNPHDRMLRRTRTQAALSVPTRPILHFKVLQLFSPSSVP